MAGVYTDNQPDFSYLAPWETKTFTQTWFPIHAIGVPQSANVEAALSVRVDGLQGHVGLQVTKSLGEVTVTLRAGPTTIARWSQAVKVRQPLLLSAELPAATAASSLSVTVTTAGRALIAYDAAASKPARKPPIALEPQAPGAIVSNDEFYLTGVHLHQYRHATRSPELYWQEALRRDAGDSRVITAVGVFCLRRGEFDAAAMHFQSAIVRLTQLNANPYDGEAFYYLGITERFRRRNQLVYDALDKATWSAAWRGPAYFALGEIDAQRNNWATALDHLERSLRTEADNLNARNLLIQCLKELGREEEAAREHRELRKLDPLDLISRSRNGLRNFNGQQRLDLAYDLLRSGQREAAARVLRAQDRSVRDGSLPMILFTLARIETELDDTQAQQTLTHESAPLDYCFPFRLEELVVLNQMIANDPKCGPAQYLVATISTISGGTRRPSLRGASPPSR